MAVSVCTRIQQSKNPKSRASYRLVPGPSAQRRYKETSMRYSGYESIVGMNRQQYVPERQAHFSYR